jgi:uncharacterized protein YjbJ (UPF0337 family)
MDDATRKARRSAEDVASRSEGTFEKVKEKIGDTIEDFKDTISEKY